MSAPTETSADAVTLESRCAMNPAVALRPEPFGALAYNYGNRRLVFLRHPDMVRLVESLDGRRSLADALEAAGIDRSRWTSFVAALESLRGAEVVRVG